MRQHDDVVREVQKHPMRVDPKNPGVVRGGWFDDYGGMLVGTQAEFVADAINEYVKIHIDRARGGEG